MSQEGAGVRWGEHLIFQCIPGSIQWLSVIARLTKILSEGFSLGYPISSLFTVNKTIS